MIQVLKLGGGRGVDHAAALHNLAERIAAGERWVLVHGGSAAADALAEQVGYPARTLVTQSGHTSRYTDPRTLDLFCQAVGGVNSALAAALTAHGTRALALNGGVVAAERKTAIRAIRDGRVMMIRDDYTGSITGIDAGAVRALLDAGITPVIAPLAVSAAGERLNIDGDLAAAHLARTLDADTLVILSNVPGLLRDVDDPASCIPAFALGELPRFAGFAGGRMKKKLLAAETAGVERVILADSRRERPIDAALDGAGTHIVREAIYA